MRKIKRILALVFLTGALNSVFATGSDVVVLMDASGTILPYFDVINNKILVDITRKFIREGDIFHLVSFNSRVNLEIVQPIQTEADISRVVSRFMLLYPLGQNSDFLSGLQFTYQYVSSLNQQRDKIIIIISDGIFNPPQSSPYISFTADQIQTELSSLSRRIRGAGWSVYYIKLPFPENAEIRTLDGNLVSSATEQKNESKQTADNNGQASNNTSSKAQKYTDISSTFTDALDIEQSTLSTTDVPQTFIDSVFSLPEIVFPENLGRKGRFFILPLKIKNISDKPINMELTGVFIDDTNILGKYSFLNLSAGSRGILRAEIQLPDTFVKGPQEIPVRLQFSGNMRVVPQQGIVKLTLTNFSLDLLFRAGFPFVILLILIFIASALVVALILFIFHRTARPASDAVRSAEQYAPVLSTTELRKKRTSAEQFIYENTIEAKSSVQNNEVATKAPTTKVEKEDKLIHFQTETKHYPVALDKKKETGSENIALLAALQTAERNERFSVLSAASKKPEIHGNTLSGANTTEHIAIRQNASVMLELHVHNQATNIGKRNIHIMKAGTRLSIGGGVSPFLVFLVKFPANIAEIRFDGKTCALAILKPQYFPYETTNIIEDCVNKEFTIVSDKSYQVTFVIQLYDDPVLKLNRLLTSIKY